MRIPYANVLLGVAGAIVFSIGAIADRAPPSRDAAASLNSGPLGAPATLSVAALRAMLRQDFANQPALGALIGPPICGVRVYKFAYATVGGEGEATDASGALMVPSGNAAPCHGPRPIVLYTHGTAINHAEDLSAVADPDNPAYGTATRIALIFAAHGYVAVAPNYAGYDLSTLHYHPYLNRRQQSQDAIDSLIAGRALLQRIGGSTRDDGQLFVTGYSQGGFVSMATLRALDERGEPATAGAPMSGPYALLAMADEIFLGHPDFGGTAYLPLVVNSYAHLEHGSIDPHRVFSRRFRDAASLFPGSSGFRDFAKLVAAGELPANAMFQSKSSAPGAPGFSPARYPALAALPEGGPLYHAGFDPSAYLVSTAFRAAYVADVEAHPDSAAPPVASGPDPSNTVPTLPTDPQLRMRRDAKANDLRNYTPSMPLLMCGGHGDPEVFWQQGAGAMTAALRSKIATDPHLRFATVDLDTSAGTAGTYFEHGIDATRNASLHRTATRLQRAFTAYQHGVDGARGSVVGMEAYHTDAAPYCMVLARSFFDRYTR
ncbi:MAG: hypothetical protein KGL36_00785 [Gammaproteobacteria bacterium]|nr:hypothetical protein [Gammaproteobacteria bacterium]